MKRFVLLALLAACSASRRERAADPAAEGSRRLASAERSIKAGHGAAAAARAAWLRYLVASDSTGATALADEALHGDAETRALALLLKAEVAEDRLDTLGASKTWAEALAAAPGHPLTELAGARLLDAEGDSQAVDEVVSAAAASLKAGADPRAARLVREAAARVAARNDAASRQRSPDGERTAWAAVGAVQNWRVAGPFAALRRTDLSKATALDGDREAPAPQRGPVGGTGERSLEFPDGDVGLELEPGEGDLYYGASDLEVQRGGDYLLWLEGSSSIEVRLDGEVKVARNPYPRELPRAVQVAVRLSKGKHRVAARWSRVESWRFRLVLARGDGAPADFTSAAPPQLAAHRASAPCALGGTCEARPAWDDDGGLRGFAERALRSDPDDPIATYLLARDALGDDRNAARGALDRLLSLTNSGAPALALHAQALLRDPEVPDRLGRSRALGDLSAAAAKDARLIRARVAAASLQRDSERFDDAGAQLDSAESVSHAPPARLILARARLLEARGNAAAARAKVEAALAVDAGRCDARQMLYELSRRDGGLEEQVRFAQALLPCADGRTQLAFILGERGRREEAKALLAQHAAARPAMPQRLETLAEWESSDKRAPQAVELLRRAAALSPRSSDPLRRLSGLLDLTGDAEGAKAARAAALQLAPGDLSLRRQVAHDRGQQLLSWADRDAVAAAKESAAPSEKPDAAAVRILDLGAVELFPDGGAVERVHTLARVLDKKGISRFGEAHIPGDAQLLRLRTIKPDGRVLEPESIPGKESVSLPGLEPGDAVETDYLRAFAPRGPEMPGMSLGAFFFRDDETPMTETAYEVRAPPGWPLEIDSRRVRIEPARVQDGQLRFRYEARNVAPQQPEPHAPPENETMPWVQAGWGASQKDFVRSIADWALLRARPGAATDALAAAAGGSSPREKAENIYAAITSAVRGRSTGSEFASPAPHVLALGRGNRLVLLKAALASAGIGSHAAMVRPFNADPSPYRFPRNDSFGYAVLRIDLPEGPIWVDPSYRLAPFGRLPSFARGQRAWLLPEPGEEPVEVTTPAEAGAQDGRALALDLRLDADGTAAGSGRDEHRGFEAASLKDSLERLDKDHRKQGVESMLSRGLRGVQLEELSAERENEIGGSGTLVYRLRAQLGRKENGAILLPATTMPARLARRWAPKADRALPLLIDAPESQSADLSIVLPQGMRLREAARPIELSTPFGAYRWSAREEAGASGAPARLIIREELRMPLQRVSAADYPAFVEFTRAVDRAQQQELRVAPESKSAPTPVASDGAAR